MILPHKIKCVIGCIEAVFSLSEKEFQKYQELSRSFENRSIHVELMTNGKLHYLFDSYADVDLYSFFNHRVTQKKRERFHRIFDNCSNHAIMSVYILK